MLNNDTIQNMKKALKSEETKKTLITLRLDENIIEFFKTHTEKYQASINKVLRAFIDSVEN